MTPADDHFSALAKQYAAGRIGYPEELYRFLAGQCASRECVWDCATGTGQAAVDLVRHFTSVVATDLSAALLAQAPAHERITYHVATAEQSGLADASVDLVTVAQALHWFDLPKFWAEVDRVLRPGGVLAYWGYQWPSVDRAVNGVLEQIKVELAPYWPARSQVLIDGYRDATAPRPEIACPPFEATARWDLEGYLAHVNSWSGTRYHREQTGRDLVAANRPAFATAWPGGPVTVRWPLVLRVYR